MKSAKSNGSYYIKVHNTKNTFSVMHQSYIDGKKSQKGVPKLAYAELGFRQNMSVAEAKARCKQLNTERSIEKDKIRESAGRVVQLITLDKTLFPESQVKDFLIKLERNNFGSHEHFKKMVSHFNFIQKMLISLKLTNPSEYAEEAKTIFKYFIHKKISLNYSKRLISILNDWAKFQCKLRGSYFEEVPIPKGRERSAIVETQKTKVGVNSILGVRMASDPLSPEKLYKIKDKLPLDQYNFLYLSVWLGLRPEECDSLLDEKNYKFRKIEDTVVMDIYQSKLMSIEEKKRWKTIPFVFEEQSLIFEILSSKNIKRPLAKIVRKALNDDRITLYGGRKAFLSLCINRGYSFVDSAHWMGHRNINTSYQNYLDMNMQNHIPTNVIKLKKVI